MSRGPTIVAATFVVTFALVAAIALGILRKPHANALLSTAAMPSASAIVPTQGRGHVVHLKTWGLACKDCHAVETGSFKRPSPERCQGCHQSRHLSLHQGPAAPSEAKDCTACHSFLPRAGDEKDPWNCIRCHAEDQGDKAAVIVHRNEYCGRCHRPHDEPGTIVAATTSKVCVGCHAVGGIAYKKHTPPPRRPCLECHKPHQNAPRGSEQCLGCHSQKEPLIPSSAIFRGGHENCEFCHSTHAEKARVKKLCRECHSTQHVVGMERVPQHGVCLSCHNQHNVLGGPGNACPRCHTAQPHRNQSIDVSRGCVACHNVHGADKAVLTTVAAGADCSGCHKIASSNSAFHSSKLVCSNCHQQHGSNPLGPRAVKACTQCHANKAELVALNAGHTNCRQCHVNQHKPLPILAGGCPNCHGAEAQSMPKGHASQNCVGCHEPHSGSKPLCTKCHESKAKAIHGNLPTGCQTCHRPHGPKGQASPPQCTTCHQPASLPSLHKVPQHASACRACHVVPHLPPRSDRATCTSCHTDRKDHNVDAAFCTGCHNFRGAR